MQCGFCEDWFHLQHVLKDMSNMDAKMEEPRTLVCGDCRGKHDFVNYYAAEEGDEEFEFDPESAVSQVRRFHS